ncbi:flagellar hook-length control protein FliK [Priestia megaterium]|uniref:flagellar hook-length control protein FliK n=1 Tax=Priestia megaterium TaxID=1404 RepID=UPI000D510948|nr:flagellar hook-length control protein FliK [Priestia megaterium]PVE72919.1 flagellar hook-length control protein FliK [Priestia megaterium]PVE89708.1 flagellar hook-length control protein FliK [Priestia megaterium]PVE90645.1 flagellar hook-length control protein FliK [Priestia megaterium]PVE96461.1 flagellar hook-length control protein FliK [Priestia megaterium]
MEISLRPAAASKVNCDEKAAASKTQGFFEEIVQQLKQLDAQPLARGEKSSDEHAVDQDVFKAVGLMAIQLSEAEDEEDEPSVLYEHLAEMISSIPSSLDLEQPLLKLQHVLTEMQLAPVSSETDSQEQYLSSISTLLTICKNTSSAFQTEFAQLMEELQKPQLQSVKLSDSQLQGLQKAAAEKIEKIHKQPRVLTDTLHEKRSAGFFAVVHAAPTSSVRDMDAVHKEEKVPLLNQLSWKKDVILRNESMNRNSSKKDSEISFTANTAGATLENNPSSFKSKEVSKVQEFSIDLGQVKSDHQQSDNLLNELQKIWSKASLSAEEGRSKLFITLFPKQLGTISIEVLQQKNETIAQVVVSSAKTKELLDANLSTLRQVLTSQHVSVVDQVDVAAVQAASESSVKDMNAFAKEEKVPQFSIDLRQATSEYQQSSDLVNGLQKIWSKASISTEEGASKLSIKLFPKQLGTISIEVRQQDNKTTAQVVVSSAKTKELLDASLLRLRQALTSQHVSVDQVGVDAVHTALESSVKDMNTFAKEEKVPQFSIDLGEVRADPQQSSDLVNELQKIWSKAELSAEEGRSKLFVTLLPKQLGTISIEMLQQDNKTTAQVVVSSAKTKELLDASLFSLRKALTSQHVSVDQVGVAAVHTASESSVRNMNAFRKEEKAPFFNQLPWKKDVVLHSESIDTNSSLKNSGSSADTNTTGATVENQPSSFGSGEMPKLQQFSIYLGQVKSDYQQSSSLVNELEKIWSKASFSTEEGTSKLFIKLFPKQLGAISIEMLQKDSETVARIVVSSAKTKELLDANLSTLRHGLASQHVSIDKIDVLLSEQTMSYNNENDQQKERQEKEAFKKEEEDQDSQQLEESASFLSSFESALINYNV